MEHGPGAIRRDAAGLLRHLRPRRRHGSRRHLGRALLPILGVRVLRRRLLTGEGHGARPGLPARVQPVAHGGVGRRGTRKHDPPAAALAGRRRRRGRRGQSERGAWLQGRELPRVPCADGAAVDLQRALGPVLRRLRGERDRGVPAHGVVRVGAPGLGRPAFRDHAHAVPGQRAHRRLRMAVVRCPVAFPRAEHRHVRGRAGLGADADGPGRLRLVPFGVGDGEQGLAVVDAPERGAGPEFLVLLDRRPFGRVPAPQDRRRPHHGGERLPACGFVVARPPAGAGRGLGRATRRRVARGGVRQRRPALPSPAAADGRLARTRRVTTPAARRPLPPAAGPGGRAGGHVVEPESAWSDLPDAVRPRIAADASGYEHVVVADTEVLAVPLGTLARPESTFDDPSAFRPLSHAAPGVADPVARLADMDAEGIDQAVLYPTIGLYFSVVPAPSAADALARAYNDWLAGYCAADARRLFGAAMLPLQDPGRAARELRRAVTELGFVAGFLRQNLSLRRLL